MDLKSEFNIFYQKYFGELELFAPVLYKFPVGIRFEIGTGDVNDEFYVNRAVDRAVDIFNELFSKDDMIFIVINSFKDNPNDLADNDISIIRPLISQILNEYNHAFKSSEYDILCTRFVLQSTVKYIQFEKLFREIIWSDIDGRNNLSSGVYIFNKQNGVMYYLYDDRGLDVVADNKTKLIGIYEKFHDWILDYDIEKINKLFTE